MPTIQELRALLATTTPGPWRVRNGNPSRIETVESGWPIADVGFNYSDAATIAAMRDALPALLDVAEAAGIVVAGFRRPQAVAPERWYAAMETMRDALAKLSGIENGESSAGPNVNGDGK